MARVANSAMQIDQFGDDNVARSTQILVDFKYINSAINLLKSGLNFEEKVASNLFYDHLIKYLQCFKNNTRNLDKFAKLLYEYTNNNFKLKFSQNNIFELSYLNKNKQEYETKISAFIQELYYSNHHGKMIIMTLVNTLNTLIK